MPDLLYEIGTEEIPAGYIAPALDCLETALGPALDEVRLTHGEVRTAGTPRRLVVAVSDVPERQPDAVEDILGPSVKAAYDGEGNPTRAAQGFARSQGVDVQEIKQRETPRGMYCYVCKDVKGRSAIEILAEVLPRITREITFPKSMTWRSGGETFARPVRSLLALFGSEIIPFELFGVKSGRTTEGHPILSPGRVELPDADFDAYKELLRKRRVIVDIGERRSIVSDGIGDIVREKPDAGVVASEAEQTLIDEVTHLVQCPSVMLCNFDPAFLKLPAPVIKAAMMEHQRYFPLEGNDGLRPHFLVVSDRGPEPSDAIRVGNEQVLRARLADAQFFDQQDRKVKLADRVKGLSGVAFLKGLGTYADKCRRLEKLVLKVSEALGLDEATSAFAARAAHLCKADLLTETVGEFPKLQGEVGRIYALREGEPAPVADAISEHYLPRSADDGLPVSPAGRALSLAEKLDNLTSCFALGLVPTGSADPYALRRQAQGALRIVEESGRHFDMASLASDALALLPEPHCASDEAVTKLRAFLRERIFFMAIARGYPHDLVNAVLRPGCEDALDFWMRLETLRNLSQNQPWWPRLVTAVERTYNITKDATKSDSVKPELFSESLETQLWEQFNQHRAEIENMETERDYAGASQRYANAFADLLHEFFEKVFVNVEDEAIRNNRRQFLLRINRLYSARIADLSQIVTGVQK